MKLAAWFLAASTLGVSSCGYQAQSISSLTDEVALLPRFQAEGKSYFLSTECSPHSLSVNLSLLPSTLEVSGIQSYGHSNYYTLNYASLAITVRTTQFQGSEPISTTRVLKKADDPAGFKVELQAVTALVDKVRNGNICFHANPELAEVVDYLKSL